MTDDVFNIQEFRIEEVDDSCSWIIVAPPKNGKSTLVLNFAYYNAYRIPVGKIFTNTKSFEYECSNIFGNLFVSGTVEIPEIKKIRKRQQKLVDPSNYGPDRKRDMKTASLTFIDDSQEGRKLFDHMVLKSFYRLGSQHWNQIFGMCIHNPVDISGIIRSASTYVAIGNFPNKDERDSLYQNFGGVFTTRKRFEFFMDEIPKKNAFTFIIIQMHGHGDIQDKVFFYKTRQIPKGFKFGCEQARKWNQQRYDPKYASRIIDDD